MFLFRRHKRAVETSDRSPNAIPFTAQPTTRSPQWLHTKKAALNNNNSSGQNSSQFNNEIPSNEAANRPVVNVRPIAVTLNVTGTTHTIVNLTHYAAYEIKVDFVTD